MLGTAFMGRVHARAWREANHVTRLPLEVVCELIVSRSTNHGSEAARQLGFRRFSEDWKAAVADPGIDLVDICLPGDLHAEVAIAALEHGKHVLCEKPLANSLDEAAAMERAATTAAARGAFAMVGFNYRRVPALALARRLIREGRVGAIRQIRATYLQDWLVDAAVPVTWRLQAKRAGTGALGDLGSHLIDLVCWLSGQSVARVSSSAKTYVRQRPGARSLGHRDGPLPIEAVDVDDAVVAILVLQSGTLVTVEASRVAPGHKNDLSLEVTGDNGALRFNLERLNELEMLEFDPARAGTGFTRLLVTEPSDPYVHGWWPPGHVLGWEHAFNHEIADLVAALAENRQPEPSFSSGLGTQAVLAALDTSSQEMRWVAPDPRASLLDPVASLPNHPTQQQ